MFLQWEEMAQDNLKKLRVVAEPLEKHIPVNIHIKHRNINDIEIPFTYMSTGVG